MGYSLQIMDEKAVWEDDLPTENVLIRNGFFPYLCIEEIIIEPGDFRAGIPEEILIGCMVIEIEFGTPLYDSSVQLRDIILRRPLNLEFTAEQLASEYDSFHFAYMDQAFEMLGCLVMKPVDPETVKMRQVAVQNGYQNKGIGTSMVFYVEQWARERGFRKIILHARDVAIPFYNKLLYQKKGKPFTEVGIEHVYMEKIL